jgi:TolB protein
MTGIAALAAALLSCSDPAAPPGGAGARRIVFVARTDFPGGNPGPPGIYSIRSNGSGLRRLTLGAGHAIAPAWSRDGGQIAFASSPEGGSEIWLMSADGGNPRRASAAFPSCGQDFTSITWNPSGTRLAAECFGQTSVFDLQSGQTYSLSDRIGRQIFVPDWSADGALLVFSGNHEHEDGPGAMVVSPEGGNVVRRFGPAADPAWSPDGSSIAFTAITEGRMAIHIANADGSGRRQVTFPPASAGTDEGPSWSPDGRWLTFHRVSTLCDIIGSPPREVCIPHWSIHIIRTDGTGLRRLTPDSLQATRPSWW